MRIRQVKPSYFKDARMAALSPSVRLFYIGLWMVADDAGWLKWDASEIANELNGYETRGKRERSAVAALESLQAVGRVEVHPCGHVFIPTLTLHQRMSSVTRQVRTVEKEHKTCLSAEIPGTPLQAGDIRSGIGTERNGDGTDGGTGSERNGQGTGSAPANTPDGAGATNEGFRSLTGLPEFLKVVQ